MSLFVGNIQTVTQFCSYTPNGDRIDENKRHQNKVLAFGYVVKQKVRPRGESSEILSRNDFISG